MKTSHIIVLCATVSLLVFMITSCAVKTEKNYADVSIEYARNGFVRDSWGNWKKP